MFKRDCYFIWLDGNNLAGRKPDKCRFHNVLACFAWLGSTALVLQVFEARKNPWIQRRTDRVRNGNLGVPLQRASGYQDWLHFYHFTLSIFLFFFFLAKTVVKMMRATIIFWTHGLIKSHSRVKIIYTVSYILSVYLKNIDWEEWEENVYKSRRSKKLWTSNFLSPPADKFKLTDFIEIESINIFLLFSQFCQIKNEYFKLIESLWERVSISEMYFLYSCLLIINRLFGRGLKLVGLTYQTRDFGLCENKKVFLYKIDVDF